MSKPVIVLNELTKSYGKHRGIENISFTVEQGEVFGFIGPNGAGKSTTIRTLMGLLKPSNGGASIFGLDCSREPARIAKDVGLSLIPICRCRRETCCTYRWTQDRC